MLGLELTNYISPLPIEPMFDSAKKGHKRETLKLEEANRASPASSPPFPHSWWPASPSLLTLL